MDYFSSMTWDAEAMLFTPWKWLLLNGIPKVRKETWHHQGEAAPEVVKKSFKKLLCLKVHALWLSSWLKDKINTRSWGKFRKTQRKRDWSFVFRISELLTFVKCFLIKFIVFSFCKENKCYHFLLTYKVNWVVQLLPSESSVKTQTCSSQDLCLSHGTWRSGQKTILELYRYWTWTFWNTIL